MVRTKLQVKEDELKQPSLVIAKHNPQDATTNPSLVLAASQKSQYADIIKTAVRYGKGKVRLSPAVLRKLIPIMTISIRL
jgi:transaldolase